MNVNGLGSSISDFTNYLDSLGDRMSRQAMIRGDYEIV